MSRKESRGTPRMWQQNQSELPHMWRFHSQQSSPQMFCRKELQKPPESLPQNSACVSFSCCLPSSCYLKFIRKNIRAKLFSSLAGFTPLNPSSSYFLTQIYQENSVQRITYILNKDLTVVSVNSGWVFVGLLHDSEKAFNLWMMRYIPL